MGKVLTISKHSRHLSCHHHCCVIHATTTQRYVRFCNETIILNLNVSDILVGFPYYLPVFAKIFTFFDLWEKNLIRKPSLPYEIQHGLWNLKSLYFQRNPGLPKVKRWNIPINPSDLHIYLYLADFYGISLNKFTSLVDFMGWKLN